MAMYARNPAVRSISAVSPDRRRDIGMQHMQQMQQVQGVMVQGGPWKQPALTPSYKGPVLQDPLKARAQSPPRVTYLCAERDRSGNLSPLPQRQSYAPHTPGHDQPQVAFDEAMTARPGMGRRLEWQGFEPTAVSPMKNGQGHMSSAASDASSCQMPMASPMQRFRDRRESGKQVPVEVETVRRGNSDSSLPSSAAQEALKEMNKEPGFDLQKQIVEEVNRVLENRLAAKEETEALKKELDKALNDREIEVHQVQHLTERLIEMEQRLEREADARRKIQAKLDQGVLIESELHQKDMKISELERKLKAKVEEARNLKVRQERLEKQVDDTRSLKEKGSKDREAWFREREVLVQERRDLEEKLFAAQTRAKSLEQRCQELEDTLKQERNSEQMLRMEKDLEQREALLKSRQQELQARLLEVEKSAEELQRGQGEVVMQKQQLKQEAAELQQQQQSWSLHVQECDQKYRTWESQRVLVEQQNEATAKQLNQMVQQNQEKVMEEVRKRAGLEQDLRQNEQQEAQLREEIQRQQEEITMQRDEITTQRDEIAMLHSQMDEVMAGHMDEAISPEAMKQLPTEGQETAELVQGINCLSQELTWLASCNAVLREHIPTDQEQELNAALEKVTGAQWQPPADMARWLRERINTPARSCFGGV
eukprot:CAMPEP_0181461042 /NCGR_PEP_ID=MMETSP1110-20121109/33665_1 /TAXON_ID=174948 /ORGANISM="Symbiodinium sp., Strain CCMP421" /LENGTH=653 /DNA_ID=CAMNT_0023585637 /DNA_START=47 /DNA_END=2008 /DNA_ORIENTATION=+